MAIHQINGFSYGNIKYKDSQGNTSNIRAVYYKDVVGSVLKIWPDEYWADNIVIKDLTSSQDINYSYDSVNNLPIYNRNGAILSGLAPGHDYVITGTIKRGDGLNFPDVNGCYFNHVTNQGANNLWYNGPGQQTDPNIINPFTGNADPYTVYRASYALVSNSSNLDEAVVLNYNIPDAQMSGMSFLGYGYGSGNYQNATPIILRRNNITGTVMFFDDANDTTNTHRITNGTSLNVGQSITVWPKVWKDDGDLYEEYVTPSNMSNVSFTGGSGYITIVDNNNGSYTITANQSSSQTISLNFSCTVDNVSITDTLDLGVVDGVYYRINVNNGPWLGSGNQNSMNIYTLSKINAQQSTDNTWSDPNQESLYTGVISIVSGDTSVLDVVSDSGNYYLRPVSTGTTTLTISINNVTWTWSTNVVNVTYNPYVISNLADSSGTYNYTSFDNNLTFNVTEIGPFVLGFSCSNALNTGDYMNVRTSSSVQGVQIAPNSSNWTNVNSISITPTQAASGTIVYEVSLDRSNVYHTITININVS